MMNISNIQMLGDGKKFIILVRNEKEEYAYIFENPLIERFDIRQPATPFDEVLWGTEKLKIPKMRPPTELNINILSPNLTFESGKNLLLNSSMFDNYTIRELFKIINKKVKKR